MYAIVFLSVLRFVLIVRVARFMIVHGLDRR